MLKEHLQKLPSLGYSAWRRTSMLRINSGSEDGVLTNVIMVDDQIKAIATPKTMQT